MARPLSSTSLRVLSHLGKRTKSVDELAARTGLRKDRLAKVLWHLERGGWIASGQETRALTVYRRMRDLPTRKRAIQAGRTPTPHIAALNAAFGIGAPIQRHRGRVVRRSE